MQEMPSDNNAPCLTSSVVCHAVRCVRAVCWVGWEQGLACRCTTALKDRVVTVEDLRQHLLGIEQFHEMVHGLHDPSTCGLDDLGRKARAVHAQVAGDTAESPGSDVAVSADHARRSH